MSVVASYGPCCCWVVVRWWVGGGNENGYGVFGHGVCGHGVCGHGHPPLNLVEDSASPSNHDEKARMRGEEESLVVAWGCCWGGSGERNKVDRRQG